jgi:hypothetical protein
MTKAMTVLGLIVAITSAALGFTDLIGPSLAFWAGVVGVAASAAGGALAKVTGRGWVTWLGVGVAVVGAVGPELAKANEKWGRVALFVGAIIAALGKGLGGNGPKPPDESGFVPRNLAFCLLALALGFGALSQAACDKEQTLAQIGLGVNTGIRESYLEVKARHEAKRITDQEAANLYYTLKQSQTASDSVNAALDKIGEIENFADNKAQALAKIREAAFQLDGVVTAAANLSDGEFAEKLKFALRAGKLGLTAAEGAVLALPKATPATAVKVKVKS